MTHPLCCCAGSCLPQGQRRRPSPTSTVSSTASPPAARRESRSRPPSTWRMYAWPPPPSLTLSPHAGEANRRSRWSRAPRPQVQARKPSSGSTTSLLTSFPPFSSVSPPAPWSAASCVLTPRCRHGRLVWRREGGRDPFGIQVEIPSWGPPRLNGSNPR